VSLSNLAQQHFGTGQAGLTLLLRCCRWRIAGEKRRSDAAPGGGSTAKRSSSSGLVRGGGSSVRAAHLLVKHRDSRRPSSWKVRGWPWQPWGGACVVNK
jgi:hypothetical protein